MAQTLKLSGVVTGAGRSRIELNLPLDAGYQEKNSIYAEVSQDGRFAFSLPVTHTQFVQLRYKDQQQDLLLSPGRPLDVVWDSGRLNETIRFAGPAKQENIWIKAHLPRPAIAKNAPLSAMTKEKDSVQELLTDAHLPQDLSTALSTEISYRYAIVQFDSRDYLRFQGNQTDWLIGTDSALQTVSLPGEKELDVSPAANIFLHDKMIHDFVKMTSAIDFRKDPAAAKSRLEEIFKMPFDSINKAGNLGDDYLVSLYAHSQLSPELQERLLVNRLVSNCNETALPVARELYKVLKACNPSGSYLSYCSAKIEQLENRVSEGRNNHQIVFRQDAVLTLSGLLAPYKGKIVYLDIWGTWCGPCREELSYVPALKERFAGKDIVFLYLDMDGNDLDDRWREFVQLHAITGQHYRMNETRMETIWEAILHTSHCSRFYPSFFIFDRQGDLVKVDAKRPSEGEALYLQLEQVLKE